MLIFNVKAAMGNVKCAISYIKSAVFVPDGFGRHSRGDALPEWSRLPTPAVMKLQQGWGTGPRACFRGARTILE
jgi:hypothetical protein